MKKLRHLLKKISLGQSFLTLLLCALPVGLIFTIHSYRQRQKIDAANTVSVGFTETPFSEAELKHLEKTKRRIETSEISLEQARKQLLSFGFFSHMSLQLLATKDMHLSLVPFLPALKVIVDEGSETDTSRDYWISREGDLFRCQKDSFRDQNKLPMAQLFLSAKDKEFFDENGLFSKVRLDEKRYRKIARNSLELSQIVAELSERDFNVTKIDVSNYRGYRVLAKKGTNSEPIELTFGYQALEASFRKLDHLLSLNRNPAEGFSKAELDYEGKIFVKKKKVPQL